MPKTNKKLLLFISIFIAIESLVLILALYEANLSSKASAIGGIFAFKVLFASLFVFLSLYFIYKGSLSASRLREQIEKSTLMTDNLRSINRNFYGVLNSINAIIFVSNMEKKEVIYANNYAISKFGEIVGKSCSLVTVNPNEAEFLQKGFSSYEFYSDITKEWYAVTEKMASWMDGMGVKIYICLNITDRKNAEAKLQEINESLEERVTSAVTEIRKKDKLLIQQSKMAAMGEMIGAIAHQWKQPLNALGLMIQDIKVSYRLGEMTDEYVEKITTDSLGQVKYMSKTIDDFKNFFKPDKPIGVFDVKQTIKDALAIVSLQIRESKIEVVKDFDDIPLSVEGYENEFKQVVLNLITNAKDAINEKIGADGGVIVIGAYQKDENVIVTVTDNGGGIADSVLGKIFEPYFTTKDQSKGTGIGLYMSKMIIEDNMGGTIFAYNADGGARFQIELHNDTKNRDN